MCVRHAHGWCHWRPEEEGVALTCCCPLPHPSVPSHFTSPASVPLDFSVSLSERNPVNSRRLPSLFLFKRRLGRCGEERLEPLSTWPRCGQRTALGAHPLWDPEIELRSLDSDVEHFYPLGYLNSCKLVYFKAFNGIFQMNPQDCCHLKLSLSNPSTA